MICLLVYLKFINICMKCSFTFYSLFYLQQSVTFILSLRLNCLNELKRYFNMWNQFFFRKNSQLIMDQNALNKTYR